MVDEMVASMALEAVVTEQAAAVAKDAARTEAWAWTIEAMIRGRDDKKKILYKARRGGFWKSNQSLFFSSQE